MIKMGSLNKIKNLHIHNNGLFLTAHTNIILPLAVRNLDFNSLIIKTKQNRVALQYWWVSCCSMKTETAKTKFSNGCVLSHTDSGSSRSVIKGRRAWLSLCYFKLTENGLPHLITPTGSKYSRKQQNFCDKVCTWKVLFTELIWIWCLSQIHLGQCASHPVLSILFHL